MKGVFKIFYTILEGLQKKASFLKLVSQLNIFKVTISKLNLIKIRIRFSKMYLFQKIFQGKIGRTKHLKVFQLYPVTKNNFSDFSILEGDLLACQPSFTTSDPVTLPSSQLSSAKLLGSQPSTVVIILEMFVFSHKLSPFPTSIRFTCMAIKTSTPKHWFSNKALGRLIKRQTPGYLIEQVFKGLKDFLAFSQVPR